METIDKVIAERFLEDPTSIDLSEYKVLDDIAADLLSTFHKSTGGGGKLYLSGLLEISVKSAKALSKQKNGGLSLNGLATISDYTAESLSQIEKEEIYLNGLANLSAEAAKAFSRSACSFSLDEVTNLCAEAAEALSCSKNMISLLGLTQVTGCIKELLGKNELISLPDQ